MEIEKIILAFLLDLGILMEEEIIVPFQVYM